MFNERASDPTLAVTAVDYTRNEPAPCAGPFEERNHINRRAAGQVLVDACPECSPAAVAGPGVDALADFAFLGWIAQLHQESRYRARVIGTQLP
jgi:hypothetical protein